MLAYLLFAVIAVFFLIGVLVYLLPSKKKLLTVPGPEPSDPVGGNLPDFASTGFGSFLFRLHEKYGDVVSFFWGKDVVVSLGSADLFKTQQSLFDRPPLVFEFLTDLISTSSVQTANGLDGQKRREIYDRAFTREACDYYLDPLQRLAGRTVQRWATQFPTSEDHLPAKEECFRFAISAVTTCLFQADGLKEAEVVELARDYDIVMQGLGLKWVCEAPPPEDPRWQAVEAAITKMRVTVAKAIAGGGVFVDRLKENLSDNPAMQSLTRSEKQQLMMADAMTFIVGGFHTTGNGLTWCLYHLAEDAELQERVFKEIRTVSDQYGKILTAADYSRLYPVTTAVFEEVIRLGLATFAARVSKEDLTIGGHLIPAGTPIIHALEVAMQQPKFWQPGPSEFNVEHHLSKDATAKRPHLAYCPFGFAGKRQCPGKNFSYLEAQVFLTEMLAKYEISLVDPSLDVGRNRYFVTGPSEEIWLKIKPRPHSTLLA